MSEQYDSDNIFDDTIPDGVAEPFQYVEKPVLTPEQIRDATLRSLLADVSIDADFVRRQDEEIEKLRELPITVERTVAIDDAKVRQGLAMARIADNQMKIAEL